LSVASLRAVAARDPDAPIPGPDTLAEKLVPFSIRLRMLPLRIGALRRRALRRIDKMFPGIYFFHLARTLHIDRIVETEVEAGARQLVLLGAGLDTRAWRLRALRGIRVFEVDHPATQAWKKARVARLGEGADVRFVATDFEKTQPFDALHTAGFDPAVRTCFLWEGVTIYLQEASIRAMLTGISAAARPGSSLTFDYAFRDALAMPDAFRGAAEHVRYAAKVGEPYRFGLNSSELAPFLAPFGLTVKSDFHATDLERAYLTRADGTLYGHLPELYAIAHVVRA
jgi:methyltransferase (TIGR00027 family)